MWPCTGLPRRGAARVVAALQREHAPAARQRADHEHVDGSDFNVCHGRKTTSPAQRTRPTRWSRSSRIRNASPSNSSSTACAGAVHVRATPHAARKRRAAQSSGVATRSTSSIVVRPAAACATPDFQSVRIPSARAASAMRSVDSPAATRARTRATRSAPRRAPAGRETRSRRTRRTRRLERRGTPRRCAERDAARARPSPPSRSCSSPRRCRSVA